MFEGAICTVVFLGMGFIWFEVRKRADDDDQKEA